MRSKKQLIKNEMNEIETQIFKRRAREAVRSSEEEWPERQKKKETGNSAVKVKVKVEPWKKWNGQEGQII